jgi:hypothetical protein
MRTADNIQMDSELKCRRAAYLGKFTAVFLNQISSDFLSQRRAVFLDRIDAVYLNQTSAVYLGQHDPSKCLLNLIFLRQFDIFSRSANSVFLGQPMQSFYVNQYSLSMLTNPVFLCMPMQSF